MQPEYLAILRLMMTELPRFPELGALFREVVPAQGFSYFHTLLQTGQRNGLVREYINSQIIARMFLGALLTYALLDGLTVNTQVPQLPDPGALDSLVDSIMALVSTQKID